jgi:hypothetical protein
MFRAAAAVGAVAGHAAAQALICLLMINYTFHGRGLLHIINASRLIKSMRLPHLVSVLRQYIAPANTKPCPRLKYLSGSSYMFKSIQLIFEVLSQWSH